MEDSCREFQEIYAAFQPKILRYLGSLVGEGEAEDLTQEVFIKAHKALETFRGESQLSTWLYRIATNTALDRMRSPSYKWTVQTCSFDSDNDDRRTEIADQNAWTGEKASLVEHQVFREEMSDCIKGYVGKLAGEQRTVLILSEFEGLGNRKIAEILEVSLDTVKIRLHRARERLKEELVANCSPYWVEDNEFIPELKLV